MFRRFFSGVVKQSRSAILLGWPTFLHLGLLSFGSIVFSMVPRWVSGFPFNRLLLSDAEFYAHSMRMLRLGFTAEQTGIPMDSKARGEQILLRGLGVFADWVGLDLLSFSVYLSIAVLIFYVLSIYALGVVSFKHRGWAFFLAAVSIVEVHVLGGTTLGFRALGFLPRDLGLGLAIWPLILYVLGVQRNSTIWIYAAFLVCGCFANYYTICFVHLCGVLWFAEIFRAKKPSSHLAGYLGIWCLAAVPALWDLLSKTRAWSPVDLEIMRMRNGFMIASPFFDAVRHYLRRFIFHSFAAFGAIWAIRNVADQAWRNLLKPWIGIAVASFILTIFGLILESQTEYLRFFFSRASLFFTIASMVLTILSLNILFQHWQFRFPNLAVLVIAGLFFLSQSNMGTIYHYWSGLRADRAERARFFDAIDVLKAMSSPRSVILAPSSVMNDLAASLRTYAIRRIYVSYKDGGVSLVDGVRARDWLRRYQKQEEILEARDPSILSQFMLNEGIDFAFLSENLPVVENLWKSSGIVTVAISPGYVIVGPAMGRSPSR